MAVSCVSNWRLLVAGLAVVAVATGCGPMDETGEVESGNELASSQSQLPSSKATAYVGNVNILSYQDTDWSTILQTQLKTSNQKTLFIDASLECGLMTSTTVKGKKGSYDSSLAEAVVYTRVLINGVAAAPGPVIYCQRTQELSAILGGVMQSCTDSNGDGTIVQDECEWTDEEISLVLSTMNANSFNFIQDVGQGIHTIEVQAKIGTRTSYMAGAAESYGAIGKGSVVVTEERLIRGAETGG